MKDILAGCVLGIFIASIIRRTQGRAFDHVSTGSYILVQTRPTVCILASSPNKAELEKEIKELNETYNNWDLREERHMYEIHQIPAPLVVTKVLEKI